MNLNIPVTFKSTFKYVRNRSDQPFFRHTRSRGYADANIPPTIVLEGAEPTSDNLDLEKQIYPRPAGVSPTTGSVPEREDPEKGQSAVKRSDSSFVRQQVCSLAKFPILSYVFGREQAFCRFSLNSNRLQTHVHTYLMSLK